jgi:hypothetical protein
VNIANVLEIMTMDEVQELIFKMLNFWKTVKSGYNLLLPATLKL